MMHSLMPFFVGAFVGCVIVLSWWAGVSLGLSRTGRAAKTNRARLDLVADLWRLADAARPAMARLGNSEWCKAMDEAQERVHKEAGDL